MSLHQQAFEGGRMVPYRHDVTQALLPFEKRLIAELGCSEKEYREFIQQVQLKYKERGEEYGHIPDIRNEITTTTLIYIAVSALFTAAAYLLTPKPKMPDSRSSRQLGGISGKEIYNSSFGFDSTQELTQYGRTIPIAFTRREETDDFSGTGGLLISPQLVWSRMRSFGAYQIAELVMIAGQGEMDRPELPGIFLGNNALDGIYDEYFDFYFTNGSQAKSRLHRFQRRFGNLRLDNDLAGSDEVFYAPAVAASRQPAFCGAFSPSSQTRFGVYSGIPNGTPYRPDWRILPVFTEGVESKAERFAKHQQKRYVDEYLMDEHTYGGDSDDKNDGDDAGMPGTGTNFARRVGIVRHISAATGASTTAGRDVADTSKEGHKRVKNFKREVDCSVDDEIIVRLGKNRQSSAPFRFRGGDPIDLTDIRSTIQSENVRYDQLFTLGATFMIGRTTWEVIERPSFRYDPETHFDDGFQIRLKCIETWSDQRRQIGLVNADMFEAEDHVLFAASDQEVHEAFYPLLRYELGTVQNTRACDVTEIGIKSQVWVKFNGITNFNTLITPEQLHEANKDNLQYTAGKITAYAKRASFFQIDVRPSNYDESATANKGWTFIGSFGVVGNSPSDIYSSIQIQHPNRDQFEFRMRPFNSAVFVEGTNGEQEVFMLDGGTENTATDSRETIYGTFRWTARGVYQKPIDLYTHSEMAAPNDPDAKFATTIHYRNSTPTKDTTRLEVELISITALGTAGSYEQGEPIRFITLSNIFSQQTENDPYAQDMPVGTPRVIENFNYGADPGKEVFLRVHLRVVEREMGHTKRNKWWDVERYELVSFAGSRTEGEEFVKNRLTAEGVRFGFRFRFKHPTAFVSADKSSNRLFQQFSGVAEVSQYGELISRSCDNGPEHEVIYVNESLTEDQVPPYSNCAVAGLKLKSSDNFQQLDQLRLYMQNGVEVERLIDGDTASSNLLTDLLWFLSTNKTTGAGNLLNESLIDKALLTKTGRYLRANKLFWDDVIAEPINLRTWLSTQAPSVLCFVALKNGKLALEPALPFFDSTHLIDDQNPVTISAMFTEGNIIENSLEINWLELEERKMFQAAVVYRKSRVNEFPEQHTLIARYAADGTDLPLEQFDLPHITSDEHARLVARYFLALRKYQTHTITFKTLPWGLNLEAGKFIRVASEMSPYRPDNNGIITADGEVISVTALDDGNYNVYYWERQNTEVQEAVLNIKNGRATDLFNSVFSLKESAASNEEVYQIEALDIDQEGIVTIKASNYAIDAEGRSKLAIDVLDTAGAIDIEGVDD
ncbi:hypothetical protein [Limnobacter sp.]|uniref:hypothetical protein n=1 Tax=Limnobacter sp. TaxID=2003368 RepID=UPI0025C48D4C|nr:hypothetical protein [Limnobacter sp.]